MRVRLAAGDRGRALVVLHDTRAYGQQIALGEALATAEQKRKCSDSSESPPPMAHVPPRLCYLTRASHCSTRPSDDQAEEPVMLAARDISDNPVMESETSVARATKLEADLHAAASALISVVERIEPERWTHVPSPSVWSVGKDAAHVAEAAVYHQWIVRLTIGQKVSGRRPVIERQELTTIMTREQAVDLIRQRTDEGAALISSLSDEQLAMPTRPPRARGQLLADTIQLVLIGHYDAHRRDIERKLRDGGLASPQPR